MSAVDRTPLNVISSGDDVAKMFTQTVSTKLHTRLITVHSKQSAIITERKSTRTSHFRPVGRGEKLRIKKWE